MHRLLEDEITTDLQLCEWCHHSMLSNHHGPEHDSGPDWCGACIECSRETAKQLENNEIIINPRTNEAFIPTPPEEAIEGWIRVINPGDLDDLPPSRRKNQVSMIDPSEWNLDDSHEPTVLKDGAEALLRIIEVVRGTSRFTEGTQYTVRFEVPAEPFSKDITDWFDEPTRGMDAKRLNDARQKMKHFMECFGIDKSRPSDPSEDWIGCEGWCILSMRTNDQYGEQNRIAKFVQAR